MEVSELNPMEIHVLVQILLSFSLVCQEEGNQRPERDSSLLQYN